MKKLIFPAGFVILLGSAAFTDQDSRDIANPVFKLDSLGEFLYTVTLNKEISPMDAQQRWFHEYLEPGINDSMFEPLLEMIRNKTVITYKPNYPFDDAYSYEEALRRIQRLDSVEIPVQEDPWLTEIVVFKNGRIASDVYSVTFHEVWFYDAATLTLTKYVKGIIPNINWGWQGGDAPEVRPTVYIPFNTGTFVAPGSIRIPFTHDFIPDGSEHLNTDRWMEISSFEEIAIKQQQTQEKILGDIKSKSDDKNFKMYESAYPYLAPIGKEARAGAISSIATANNLLFCELWEINPGMRAFRKKVVGIVPQFEKRIESEEGEERWEYQPSVFVPFNSFTPVAPAGNTSVSRISFDVNFRRYSAQFAGQLLIEPHLSHPDSIQFDSMSLDISEHVRRHEIKVYGPKEEFGFINPFANDAAELNQEQVHRLFYHIDSVFAEDFNLGHMEVREWEFGNDVNCGFRFYETWNFNPSKNTFTKEIPYVGMNGLKYNKLTGELQNLYCRYFYYNPRTPVEAIRKPEYLMSSNVVSPVLLNSNEFYLSESQYGISIVNYSHSWHENIDPSQRYAFVQPIVDMIVKGKIKARSYLDFSDELTVESFRSMIVTTVGKNQLFIRNGMEYALFNQLFFYEDWYYNPATGQIYKDVKAVMFAYRGPDVLLEDGRILANIQPCFALVMNNYK